MVYNRRVRTLVALLLLSAGVARGGETESAVGRMHFEEGQRRFRAGDFKGALPEFTAGYELTRRPAFLLDIAQCYRLLGDRVRASEYYRTFLTLEPASELAPAVRKLIEEIDAELRAALPPPPVAAPPPAVIAPAPPPRRRHLASAVLLGVASGALATAVILTATSHAQFDELQASCAPPRGPGCTGARIDPVERQAHASVGLYASAGALGVAALVAYLVERRR